MKKEKQNQTGLNLCNQKQFYNVLILRKL